MKKIIQRIIAIILVVGSIIWLIPTVCVKDNIETTIKSYEIIEETETEIRYNVTFAYQKDGEEHTGNYKVAYTGTKTPLVGEQGKCYLLTCPPYTAHNGDPGSPFYPLVVLLVGILLLFFEIKIPKAHIKRKKVKTEEIQAEPPVAHNENTNEEESNINESQS